MENNTDYGKELMAEINRVILKEGNHEVSARLSVLIDKPKFEIVDGLEKIIADIKCRDLNASKAEIQIIKHVYRKMTS
jgi:hypothetical protein